MARSSSPSHNHHEPKCLLNEILGNGPSAPKVKCEGSAPCEKHGVRARGFNMACQASLSALLGWGEDSPSLPAHSVPLIPLCQPGLAGWRPHSDVAPCREVKGERSKFSFGFVTFGFKREQGVSWSVSTTHPLEHAVMFNKLERVLWWSSLVRLKVRFLKIH